MAAVFSRTYFAFVFGGLFSAFLGSQCVHNYYKPLDDLPQVIEAVREARKKAKAQGPDLTQEKPG